MAGDGKSPDIGVVPDQKPDKVGNIPVSNAQQIADKARRLRESQNMGNITERRLREGDDSSLTDDEKKQTGIT